ncbi:MAG: MFS transporter [Novosphingobium sp.]|nr:MFS transporter [Novosphingobium sp.]MCP5401272.1 MFS transporter [Novosphingobium sp.]
MATIAEPGESPETNPATIPKSAYYALALLASANLLNYLDRNIVSILAEAIKADLGLDDAQLGFIMGTAFAVFYAVIGIAMGRISDGLSRKKVMAFGLALWSGMTALGAAASNFLVLAIARIGVGVGEAAASPCSQSLLADIFPQRRRGIAMSVYLTGTFVGGALSMIIGGYILQNWPTACTSVPVPGACDIAGWKAALLIAGFPGLLLALAILTIREPSRTEAREAPPFRFIVGEFANALPPFTLASVYRAGGAAGLANNVKLAAAIAAACGALVWLTGDVAQWVAVAIGLYSITTWGQIQSLRDRPLFALTFGDPTFLAAMGASALFACAGAGSTIWTVPYAIRNFDLTPDKVGLYIGVINLVGAIIGVLIGGWLADRWKQRDLRAPLWIMGISACCNLVGITILLSVTNVEAFLFTRFALAILGSLWGGSTAAMIQDLVIPRMRGSAAGTFTLVSIVISSGMGPYWAGKISVISGSLTAGILSLLVLIPLGLALLVVAARRMPNETTAARMARAVAAGEPEPQEKRP